MRPRPSSVRVRLTFWYSAALALIILAFSLGVFLFVRASLSRQLDRQLDSDFQAVAQALSEESSEISEAEGDNAFRIFELFRGQRSFLRRRRSRGRDSGISRRRGRRPFGQSGSRPERGSGSKPRPWGPTSS